MQFWIDVLNTGLIIAIFAVSLNVILGAAGQLSIAPAGLGGIGGYVAGYLSAKHGWSFVPCMFAGVVGAGIIGLCLGIPALRLSTDYLILLTLAFATVIVAVFEAIPVLGGTYGLLGVQPVHFGGTLLTPGQYFRVIVIVCAIAVAFCWRMTSSPYGRVLRGIREDTDATEAVGKNVVIYKISTFAWTAAVQGLGGAMLVFYQQLAAPTQFSFSVTTTMIAAVVIGGMGNPLGAFIGALLLNAIGPVLQKLVNINPDKASLWQLVIYGFLLVIVMRVRPQGLFPEGMRLRYLVMPKYWARNRKADDPSLVLMAEADNPFSSGNGHFSDGSGGGHFSEIPREGSVHLQTDIAAASEELEPVPALGPDGAPAGGEHGITAHIPGTTHLEFVHADVEGRPKITKGEDVLVATDLVKSFGGIQAVRGLDIRLPSQMITALVGPNGAGKTTVFNLITGRIKPDEGSVVLRGKDITGWAVHKVTHDGMARSFQDVRTFQRLSLLNNVMLSVPHQSGEHFASLFLRPWAVRRDEKAAQEEATQALAFVGLEHRAHEYAGGLGYGDQKLLAIARLLATRADILLLDEPASGIDRSNLEPVLEVIERLREAGTTICLVEHNLDVVTRLADHILFMEAGRVVAEGSMEEITKQPRLAEVYFGES